MVRLGAQILKDIKEFPKYLLEEASILVDIDDSEIFGLTKQAVLKSIEARIMELVAQTKEYGYGMDSIKKFNDARNSLIQGFYRMKSMVENCKNNVEVSKVVESLRRNMGKRGRF